MHDPKNSVVSRFPVDCVPHWGSLMSSPGFAQAARCSPTCTSSPRTPGSPPLASLCTPIRGGSGHFVPTQASLFSAILVLSQTESFVSKKTGKNILCSSEAHRLWRQFCTDALALVCLPCWPQPLAKRTQGKSGWVRVARAGALQELNRALAHVVGATEGVAGHDALAVPSLAVVKRGSTISVRATRAQAHVAREVLNPCNIHTPRGVRPQAHGQPLASNLQRAPQNCPAVWG